MIDFCSECHNSSEFEAGIDLTGFDAIADDGELVIAGNAELSLLLQVMEAGIMPPIGRPAPSDAEIATVRAWIEAGGANN